MRIFVSYRRSDVGGYSGRLTDALVARLGSTNIFQDVAAIAPGRDFEAEIDRSLGSADAVLAVIGPGWLSAETATGQRRLSAPDDFVRRELASALARELLVVPVLVGGAAMPGPDDLPADLAALTRRQAVALRDESFHADVDRLVRTLRDGLRPAGTDSSGRRRTVRRAAVAGSVLVLAAAGAGGWWLQHRGGDGDSAGLTGCPAPTPAQWTEIAVDGSKSATVQVAGQGSLTFAVNAANWRPESGDGWNVVLDNEVRNGTARAISLDSSLYYRVRVGGREYQPTCFDTRSETVSAGAVADTRVGFLVSCPPAGTRSLTVEWLDVRKQLAFTTATSPSTCRP